MILKFVEKATSQVSPMRHTLETLPAHGKGVFSNGLTKNV